MTNTSGYKESQDSLFTLSSRDSVKAFLEACPRLDRMMISDSTKSRTKPMLCGLAEWQSGHAAACKAVYAGSIPTSASIYHTNACFLTNSHRLLRPAHASALDRNLATPSLA